MLFALTLLAATRPVAAQDRNIVLPVAELDQMLRSEPMRIVSAEISRPKAKGDITLKADVVFGDRPPMRIKLRKAEPGADTFNNVPRYDLAAYELQKLLLDEPEYVVPPTALRMVPISDLLPYASAVRPTFKESDDVLCVVQYWLQEVTNPPDVLDLTRFVSDGVYARHIGQLNVFTYLIRHGDSNLGNFLLSTAPEGARVFSVDNGIAFASEASDRGELWRQMRVERVPADVVRRLEALTESDFTSRLGVLAQWRLENGRYVAVGPGENPSPARGVRRDGATVQMGLTRSEIAEVWRRAERLLQRIDAGEIVAQ
jgi:hypothetical protein